MRRIILAVAVATRASPGRAVPLAPCDANTRMANSNPPFRHARMT